MSKLSKQTVDLLTGDVRISKIRRDPVPMTPARKIATYRDDNEKRTVLVGIACFSIALFIIILQFSDFTDRYLN
ncbi:MAG: hypothetical protein ABIO29_02045 [Sphingomicrobium sp.]